MHHKAGDWMPQRSTAKGCKYRSGNNLSANDSIDLADEAQTNLTLSDALLVTGLTLYTFRSKRDFSFLGATLFPLTFGLFIFGLLCMFFPSLNTGLMGLLVSFAGAGIFCAWLVFDTWRISQELDVDDYVEGAIQLYMDIVNIFLYVLEILVQMSKGRD
mmetsp:Transcript_11420/g.13374  ORF Transcript_11420/g.13374 Transcript_11420/m.13374 type:complete len:159 (+) Transcript_11420:156-632(+)